MATEARSLNDVDLSTSRRALILVWQNPTSRRFVKVGQADALPGGRFAFHYLPTAFDDPEFFGLDEFPAHDAVYVSDEVPAFFANRVLSSERRGYATYLEWLGLADTDENDIPFEVLARTGAGRATDTFHVVDVPAQSSERFSSRFFVSGIRYAPHAGQILAELGNGSKLHVELDETNAYNPQAVLINATDGRKIGFVPDWLCGDIHSRLKEGWRFTAVAERVNATAPMHLRLLCRIDAQRERE